MVYDALDGFALAHRLSGARDGSVPWKQVSQDLEVGGAAYKQPVWHSPGAHLLIRFLMSCLTLAALPLEIPPRAYTRMETVSMERDTSNRAA